MGDRVHVGTSGWTYDDWNGPFYPKGVRGSDRLAFYAERFDTVEVNATFYRPPTATMIAAWNRHLPRGYHLVLKGPRRVTHLAKLNDCESAVKAFLDRAAQLESLRCVLWQLPPQLHRDLPRLEAFLDLLPARPRHAIEFRHPSWFDDAVAARLAEREVAFVAVSHPALPPTVYPTTDLLYLRFHGTGARLYDHDYSQQALAGWVGRLTPHLEGRTLYAFFNNDVACRAPKNAAAFRAMLGA